MSEPIDTISILLEKEKKYDRLVLFLRERIRNDLNFACVVTCADALKSVGERVEDGEDK